VKKLICIICAAALALTLAACADITPIPSAEPTQEPDPAPAPTAEPTVEHAPTVEPSPEPSETPDPAEQELMHSLAGTWLRVKYEVEGDIGYVDYTVDIGRMTFSPAEAGGIGCVYEYGWYTDDGVEDIAYATPFMPVSFAPGENAEILCAEYGCDDAERGRTDYIAYIDPSDNLVVTSLFTIDGGPGISRTWYVREGSGRTAEDFKPTAEDLLGRVWHIDMQKAPGDEYYRSVNDGSTIVFSGEGTDLRAGIHWVDTGYYSDMDIEDMDVWYIEEPFDEWTEIGWHLRLIGADYKFRDHFVYMLNDWTLVLYEGEFTLDENGDQPDAYIRETTTYFHSYD
jgi:hypothetical protein